MSATTSEPSSSSDRSVKQCRFCLESSEAGLVSPCACTGTAEFVHESCLSRWRNESQSARKACSVCGSAWSIPAPPRIREFFVRTLRTAERYHVGPRMENEAEVRALIETGSLIAQTVERATQIDQRQRNTWTAQHQSLPPQGQQQIRRRRRMAFVERDDGSSNGSVRSLLSAVISARCLQHWHRSVFVILYVGRGAASDGSDTVVACNLTRSMASFLNQGEGEASNGTQQDVNAQRDRRLSWLRSTLRTLRRNPLPESSSSSSSDDDDDDDSCRELKRAARAVRDLRDLGIEVKHFRGGPVDKGKPLGLLFLHQAHLVRGNSDQPPVVGGVDVEPWTCADLDENCRAYVGSISHLAQCARVYSARGWSGTALCFAGVAVWSSNQLVAEIARRSWIISPGSARYVLDDTGSSLWNTLTQGRDVPSGTVVQIPNSGDSSDELRAPQRQREQRQEQAFSSFNEEQQLSSSS